MLVTCAILGWIVIKDFRDHIITNLSLIVLSCSLLLTFKGSLNLALASATFIALILVSFITDLGGGDIKLITVLTLFAEINYSFLQYIAISTALVSIQIVIVWIKNRKISARVPLAPSICIPMIYSMALR
jgi:Flp pilus assembly protein protease CpaA